MKRLFALAAIALAACGGGGGESSSPQSPPSPSVPHTRPSVLYTGFFGVGGDQLAKTSSFVNVVHVPDWGDQATPQGRNDINMRSIATMQEARARGITAVILMTGYLSLDAQCRFTNLDELRAFKQQLDALDLTSMVVATYPIDEPDLRGCADVEIRKLYRATKDVFNVPVAVIYSDHGTPGIEDADWIGRDRYGKGPQLVPIRDDQMYIVISGGANPWRESPFASFSLANPRVAVDLAFLYVDFSFPEGVPQKGISSNGLLAAYCEAGKSITHKPGTC